MPVFDVYSRRGCHLCDALVEELADVVSGRAAIAVHDVDSRDDWRQAFGRRVPVVQFEGADICEYTLDREAIRATLADRA